MKKISKKSRDSFGGSEGMDNDPSSQEQAPSSATKMALNKFSSQIKKSTGAAADTMKKMPMALGTIHHTADGVSASSPLPPSSMRKSYDVNQPFESSEGAMRLNRILDQSSQSKTDAATPSYSLRHTSKSTPLTDTEHNNSSSSINNNINNTNSTPTTNSSTPRELDYIPPSTVQLSDPTDENAVGEMTCRISSKQRVDSRSIGEDSWRPMERSRHVPGTYCSARDGRNSMCVSQFDLSVGLSGGPSGGKKRHIPIAKTRNKLRYVVILRSTNRPLLRPRSLGRTRVDGNVVGGVEGLEEDDLEEESEDDGSEEGYDHMFNPDPSEGPGSTVGSLKAKKKKLMRKNKNEGDDANNEDGRKKNKSKLYEEYDCGIPPEKEISSFPALLCLAIHADGTKPDVRKVLELDKLVSIENCPPRKNSQSAGHVVLVFRNGDAVEIDCDLPNAVMHSTGVSTVGGAAAAHAVGKKSNTAIDAANRLRKERFLWSLLQIHAILCTAVVERSSAAAALARPGSVMATAQLPPLKVLNIDRGELQYISTVKGF
eukprot:CCRYP_007898-RB/>CCRYP_007898-RB protein AED:0.33 eAED:0.33 QI:0/0/0/1/1/1/2/0/542